MAARNNNLGRSDPPGNDESSESEDEATPLDAFSESASGQFRSKALAYDNQPQFPTAALYKLDEEVYHTVVGQTQPTGPYVVVAILANRRYRLKQKDNGQELPQPVSEDQLLVRAD